MFNPCKVVIFLGRQGYDKFTIFILGRHSIAFHGCFSGPFSASIAQVIRQTKPDRLIIEPSGLGHPAGAFCDAGNVYFRPFQR